MSNYQMNSKEFIMLAGAPCSGKSTYAKTYIDRGYVHISSDKHIDEYAKSINSTYSEVFNEYIKTATKMMYDDLDQAIKDGKNIIWDQTNLSRKSRLEKKSRIPNEYKKVCVYFDAAYSLLIDRNEKRYNMSGKYIPEEVLMRMAVQAEAPTDEERWDIIVIKVITE